VFTATLVRVGIVRGSSVAAAGAAGALGAGALGADGCACACGAGGISVVGWGTCGVGWTVMVRRWYRWRRTAPQAPG
jgi:hypothetical protein